MPFMVRSSSRGLRVLRGEIFQSTGRGRWRATTRRALRTDLDAFELAGVFEHLPFEILRVRHTHVRNATRRIGDRLEPRLNKTRVRRQVEAVDAGDDFVPQRRAEMYTVGLEQRPGAV